MSSARRLLSATAVVLVAGAGAGSASAATINEFALSGPARAPAGITAGLDGNVWFTERANPGAIGQITPSGTIQEFTANLTANSQPSSIATGPDGNLWFTEWANPGRIGRVTPGGAITELPRNNLTNDSDPGSITAGPDDNLWFTESTNPGRIGRITTSGAVTEFTTGLTANSNPSSITAGPDGNLWFTESTNPGRIGRITSSGAITEFTTGLTANSNPSSITAGPDGNLWFTESTNPGRIGRITSSGAITEFTGLTANSDPNSITTGPDGNLWFTELNNPGRIGRISPSGVITEQTTPTTSSLPQDIAAGPDRNLWFTELGGNGRIGRLTPDPPSSTTQPASSITSTTATLAGTVNPNSAATTYHFDFGMTTGYGQRSPAADAVVGADGTAHAVTQSMTGLLASTTYHDRLVATGGAGTAYGADATFTTPAQPSTLTTSTPIVTPTTTPAPPMPPLPPAPPPAPPILGRTALAGVVSGTVLVRRPGSSSLQALGADQDIPMGSLINAAHGVVKLTDAIDRKGHTQSATVWAGSFVVTQARSGRGLTTFRIAGSPGCPAHGAVTTHEARTALTRSRPPVRLWGKDHHGAYSTRGRNSVATVRGTEWETVETCRGTRTVVRQGLVSVRDLHRHTTVLLRAGHSYLARP